MGKDGTLMIFANNGVALPVAYAAFFLNYFRSFLYINSSWNKPATGSFLATPIVFFAARSSNSASDRTMKRAQMRPQIAPFFLVCPDVPVNPFVRDGNIGSLKPTADLIGAPLLVFK